MIKDYHNLYLEYDALLLADVFRKFRNNSLRNYGLCPSHYLSWDAVLNKTKIKLELISDLDMYIFFEKGMIAEFLIFLIDAVKPIIGV